MVPGSAAAPLPVRNTSRSRPVQFNRGTARPAVARRRAVGDRRGRPRLVDALGWWTVTRTPPTLVTGAADRTAYLLTQPFVALRYFGSFLAPIGLSADSDWPLVSGPTDPMVIAGAAFVMTVLWAIWRLRDREPGRFIAFGLAWFVLALLPTSLTPLAEVANDHRMFFPFVGLSLAVATAGAWLLARLVAPVRLRTVAPLVVGLVLVVGAVGVRARNEVWRADETLWRDVTEKGPRNGRGWMNYGVTIMARGDFAAATAAFDRAAPLTPNYSLLFINRGVTYASLSRQVEAEQAFVRAIAIAPADWRSHTFYARWLAGAGRRAEALAHAQLAAELNPADPMGSALVAENARLDGTPEFFLARSLAEHQMSRYRASLASAERAIAQRPDYAEAFNNVAAAHLALGEWDEAIKAAEVAVRLNPRLQIAQNNLAWARQQKDAPPMMAGIEGRGPFPTSGCSTCERWRMESRTTGRCWVRESTGRLFSPRASLWRGGRSLDPYTAPDENCVPVVTIEREPYSLTRLQRQAPARARPSTRSQRYGHCHRQRAGERVRTDFVDAKVEDKCPIRTAAGEVGKPFGVVN